MSVTRVTLTRTMLVESLGDRHRAFKVEPVSEGDNVVSLRKDFTFTDHAHAKLGLVHAPVPLHAEVRRTRQT